MSSFLLTLYDLLHGQRSYVLPDLTVPLRKADASFNRLEKDIIIADSKFVSAEWDLKAAKLGNSNRRLVNAQLKADRMKTARALIVAKGVELDKELEMLINKFEERQNKVRAIISAPTEGITDNRNGDVGGSQMPGQSPYGAPQPQFPGPAPQYGGMQSPYDEDPPGHGGGDRFMDHAPEYAPDMDEYDDEYDDP